MTPSTLSFVLRWQAGLFWAGLAIALMSGYQLLNYQPNPEIIGVVSVVSLVGAPVCFAGFFAGIGMIAMAWTRAAKLRNGS